MREIESADVSALVEEDAGELLQELNSKRRRWRTWPFFLGCTALGFGASLAADNGSPWLILFTLAALFISSVAVLLDRRRKTTVLFYELEPPVLGRSRRSAPHLI
jgi:hypothetical protein